MMHLVPVGRPGQPLRILALGAHADDIEIGCGATLRTLIAAAPGAEVRWVVFSAQGGREAEARASAACFLEGAMAARVEVHSFRDGFFPSECAAIKERFEALKADFEPDLVFTHRTDDAHQDHRVLGELAWNTWRDHFVLEYEVPKYDGDLGRPNVYVPVPRAVAEAKADALIRHFASQRDRPWFTRETFLGLMRIRAVETQCAEEFAEAFQARKIVFRGGGGA